MRASRVGLMRGVCRAQDTHMFYECEAAWEDQDGDGDTCTHWKNESCDRPFVSHNTTTDGICKCRPSNRRSQLAYHPRPKLSGDDSQQPPGFQSPSRGDRDDEKQAAAVVRDEELGSLAAMALLVFVVFYLRLVRIIAWHIQPPRLTPALSVPAALTFVALLITRPPRFAGCRSALREEEARRAGESVRGGLDPRRVLG